MVAMPRQSRVTDPKESTLRQVEYQSALFKQFSERVEAIGPGAAVLDLGASNTRNLMYWIQRGHSVSALDLAARAWKSPLKLDYPDRAFGGVACWTAISQLSQRQSRELIQELGRILMPDGWVFAVFDGDGRKPPAPQRYAILGSDRLAFEPLRRRAEPRAVLTREIETLFEPLREVRIMVMRHGSREALGRRP